MKKWTTPMAMEECFTANVDVAVSTCYQVACDAEEANNYEWGCSDFSRNLMRNHNIVHCTYPEKNKIQVDPQTHKITGMIGDYVNGEGPCQFTNYKYQPINPNDLRVGDRVYWTHKGHFGTYHHQGNLELANPDQKLMS